MACHYVHYFLDDMAKIKGLLLLACLWARLVTLPGICRRLSGSVTGVGGRPPLGQPRRHGRPTLHGGPLSIRPVRAIRLVSKVLFAKPSLHYCFRKLLLSN